MIFLMAAINEKNAINISFLFRLYRCQDQQALVTVHLRCHKTPRIRQHRQQTHTAQPALNKRNEHFSIE